MAENGRGKGRDEQDIQDELIVEEPSLRYPSFSLPHMIARCGHIPPQAKSLYLAILSHAAGHADRTAWPGHDVLAAETGMSRRSVVTWMAWLRKERLLDWKRKGFGGQNIYTVLAYPDWLTQCLTAQKSARKATRARGKASAQAKAPAKGNGASQEPPSDHKCKSCTYEDDHKCKSCTYEDDEAPISAKSAPHKCKSCTESITSRSNNNKNEISSQDSYQHQQRNNKERTFVETEDEGKRTFAAGAAAGDTKALEQLLKKAGVRGKLRREVLAAKPSLADARAAFLYAYLDRDIKNPTAFAATLLKQREENTLPDSIRRVAGLSVEEIVREEMWAEVVEVPEAFPWWLWTTTWEEASEFADEPGFQEPEGEEVSVPEVQLPPCLYGECERARALWEKALERLKVQFPRQTFQTWFAPSVALGIDGDGDTLVVGVPDEDTLKFLEKRAFKQVSRTVSEISPGTRIEFEVQG